ncbi:MAG: RtcB family protein [Proteobacteria bacterium]|nr:MAG: RtcB family protein [Pseudomonadota bacterium]
MVIARIENTGRVPVKIWTNEVEESALKQLRNTATLPFVYKHVAVMPDVHCGIGATVGSVVPTKGAIVPACVGVDIGCGMSAIRLDGIHPHDLEGTLPKLRRAIENTVPVGMKEHKREEGVKSLAAHHIDPLVSDFRFVRERLGGRADKGLLKVMAQLGSLGGGNHFIEICLSNHPDEVWLMLHSGSRGMGNIIGQHYIAVAKAEMERASANLADPDLAYLLEGSTSFQNYVSSMRWAQEYAFLNRKAIGELTLRAIYTTLNKKKPQMFDEVIDCHHNYVAEEVHFGEKVLVTRKGAVKAGPGDKGIIPGSMGARSFLVKGLGNPESFHSCSHGAGRRMSRGEAKKRFNRDDLMQQTAGIECRKDEGVIDEIPGAYKDIDKVMSDQRDLVVIERELRQVVCVKG